MKYWILIAVIVLIRLPFLNQAVTGDDVYYLASAEHAQIDPLHPNHTTYVFQGKDVDFRGYPHPPLNAWVLAGLIAVFGDVKEVPFHCFYLLFSVMAVSGMWVLAKRFSPEPFWATMLFIAVPMFVVNGNSFEADVPLTAFLLAGVAAFVTGVDRGSWRWLTLASLALGAASLVAVQAVFVTPILLWYAWRDRGVARRPGGLPHHGWLAALAPVVVLAAWQGFEYLSIGKFPILMTSGYVLSYGLAKLQAKLVNFEGLTVQAAVLMWPLVFLRKTRGSQFLFWWIGLFFLGDLAMFSNGSARYLLPIAAPVALLISRLPVKWVRVLVAAQLTLALLMAGENYQHWSGYRAFARSLSKETKARRTWVNAEWGLRWYMEALGARPMHDQQRVPPGDMVVSSELAYPVPYRRGGSTLVPIASREITSSIPLRLIGLNSRAGYSTADRGLFPFGISNGPIDRVRADVLVEHHPTLEYLPMDAPEADDQIVSGIYGREGTTPWRWTAGAATVALKVPSRPKPLHVELFIPGASNVRVVKVLGDGKEIYERVFDKPGSYSIDTPPSQAGNITLQFDKSFSIPSDHRELGVILTGIGYRQ